MATDTTGAPGSPAEFAARHGLRNLADVPPIREYLRELWARRAYAVRVPMSELRSQNLNRVLGQLWFVMNPVLLVAVYFLFFGVILGTDRGVENFLAFLSVGVFTFAFTQRTVIQGSGVIVSNIGLIRSIRFPRVLLPISAVIGQTVAHLPAIAVLLAISVASGSDIRIAWLVLPTLLALQAAFNFGVTLIAARITTVFRDVQNLLPFLFRLLFYMSGTLYSVDRFVSDPLLRDLFNLNPMFAIIELFRWSILGLPADGWAVLSATAWTVVLVPVGFLVFRAGEARFGEA